MLGKSLAEQVERAAQAQGDADELRREARVVGASLEVRHNDQARQPAATVVKDVGKKLPDVEAPLQDLEVRPLAVYEHPPLLRRASATASARTTEVRIGET